MSARPQIDPSQRRRAGRHSLDPTVAPAIPVQRVDGPRSGSLPALTSGAADRPASPLLADDDDFVIPIGDDVQLAPGSPQPGEFQRAKPPEPANPVLALPSGSRPPVSGPPRGAAQAPASEPSPQTQQLQQVGAPVQRKVTVTIMPAPAPAAAIEPLSTMHRRRGRHAALVPVDGEALPVDGEAPAQTSPQPQDWPPRPAVKEPTTVMMPSIPTPAPSSPGFAAVAEPQTARLATPQAQERSFSSAGFTAAAPSNGLPRDWDPDLAAALRTVQQRNASDLHVSADAIPQIRIDGDLQPLDGRSQAWSKQKTEQALRSIMNDEQWDALQHDWEHDFSIDLDRDSRFRVNAYFQRTGLAAAFRLIPNSIATLDDLGMPAVLRSFCKLPRGLVLVTGPTGSGKSTTLAAMLDEINQTRHDHIITVEDPIEFVHHSRESLINQREVGKDTRSFGEALRRALRQDPDVILVGELRDLETIQVALTAAETGHLVFSTLHTQDAAQTVDRVIDVFPPHQQDQVRVQLGATLKGVVAQTLMKRIGGGRVAASEIMVTTPAISNMIREGKTYQIYSAVQSGRDAGMRTLDQNLKVLVDSGAISREEAAGKAHDPAQFLVAKDVY
jgi:twitching motility protein PilT